MRLVWRIADGDQAEGQLRVSRWKAEAREEGLQALLGEHRENDPTTLWLRAKVALVSDAVADRQRSPDARLTSRRSTRRMARACARLETRPGSARHAAVFAGRERAVLLKNGWSEREQGRGRVGYERRVVKSPRRLQRGTRAGEDTACFQPLRCGVEVDGPRRARSERGPGPGRTAVDEWRARARKGPECRYRRRPSRGRGRGVRRAVNAVVGRSGTGSGGATAGIGCHVSTARSQVWSYVARRGVVVQAQDCKAAPTAGTSSVSLVVSRSGAPSGRRDAGSGNSDPPFPNPPSSCLA